MLAYSTLIQTEHPAWGRLDPAVLDNGEFAKLLGNGILKVHRYDVEPDS